MKKALSAFFALLIVLFSFSACGNTVVGTETSALSDTSATEMLTEKSFFSNDELAEMAQDYYASLNGGSIPSYVATQTNEDGSVTIQLYDLVGDHNSTAAWYTVDPFTATGVNESSGEKVDLK